VVILSDSLRMWAHARGYEAAVAGFEVVTEVRKTIEALKNAGSFDERFFDKCVKGFRYDSEIAEPKIVIMLSVPRPAHYITFSVAGKQLAAIVPPTYAYYREEARRVRDEILSAGILKSGQQLVPLRAPLKSVAARVGLVRYGRNNITYTRSRGSYHQIVGLASDAPPGAFEIDPVLESPGLMDECLRCRACAASCPTGAIPGDRFLLRAHRCLTFLNEFPGEWPDWVDPSWHNAFVGCMKCQACCPMNAGNPEPEDTGVRFDEPETTQLLSDEPLPADVWRGLDLKIESAGLGGDRQDVVRRNLRALIKAQGF
jgi:epoxyqueuosine reductase